MNDKNKTNRIKCIYISVCAEAEYIKLSNGMPQPLCNFVQAGSFHSSGFIYSREWLYNSFPHKKCNNLLHDRGAVATVLSITAESRFSLRALAGHSSLGI
jgi:hypothetical protein